MIRQHLRQAKEAIPMKSLSSVAMAVILAGAAAVAFAQTPATPGTTKPAATPPPAATPATPPPATVNPQQERMKMCNEKATGMKGDERKNYMSACLAGKEPEKKLTAQQQRMTDCNKKAGDMKGDERKKFMADCLKAKT
jgi:psiF repeat